MWMGILTILYFLAVGYLPWILLIVSLIMLVRGILLEEWKPIFVGFLLFLPNVIAMLFVELEPWLYLFALLPIIHVLFGLRYYRLEKQMMNTTHTQIEKEPS